MLPDFAVFCAFGWFLRQLRNHIALGATPPVQSCPMMHATEIDGQVPVIATVVEEPIKQIQIPPNMRPGDSFIVTPDNYPPFTVIVPEGATPGSFVTVVIPSEMIVGNGTQTSSRGDFIKVDKGVAGAAVVGGVIGLVVLGSVGGIVLAGGAAYAATRKDSKIGRSMHRIGDKSYKSIAAAKNWTMEKLSK